MKPDKPVPPPQVVKKIPPAIANELDRTSRELPRRKDGKSDMRRVKPAAERL